MVDKKKRRNETWTDGRMDGWMDGRLDAGMDGDDNGDGGGGYLVSLRARGVLIYVPFFLVKLFGVCPSQLPRL